MLSTFLWHRHSLLARQAHFCLLLPAETPSLLYRNKRQPYAVECCDIVFLGFGFGADRSECVARGGGRTFVRSLVRLLGRDLENPDPPPVRSSQVGVFPAASAVVGRHPPRNRIFEAVRLKVALVAMLLTRSLIRQAHHHHYYCTHRTVVML